MSDEIEKARPDRQDYRHNVYGDLAFFTDLTTWQYQQIESLSSRSP
jgi:hypothetical protein